MLLSGPCSGLQISNCSTPASDLLFTTLRRSINVEIRQRHANTTRSASLLPHLRKRTNNVLYLLLVSFHDEAGRLRRDISHPTQTQHSSPLASHECTKQEHHPAVLMALTMAARLIQWSTVVGATNSDQTPCRHQVSISPMRQSSHNASMPWL